MIVMSSNKNVVVLMPNGRRQNVKITPNTTILQVLEEACQKHGYNADEFDLKHHNHLLDLNTIFRFAGLPNNALLETTDCVKIRPMSKVTIGIQLENGERLTGEFLPKTTLSEILNDICPRDNLESTVLIYMHQKIYGKKSLEETNLKLLGITSGRAVLRLIHRSEEQLKTQAHIYVPTITKPLIDPDACVGNETKHSLHSESKATDILLSTNQIENEQAQEKIIQTVNKEKDLEGNDQIIDRKKQPSGVFENDIKNQYLKGTSSSIEKQSIKFLGERNAVVFDQSLALPLPKDEFPDDFYNLTVDDAKILLRDTKRKREELEDAPLMTSNQRQLEHDKIILCQLHRYRKTIIRVHFPDGLVLQGIFGPLETVKDIQNFVNNHLDDPDCNNELYTSPPKTILNPLERLVDVKLVPSAILYYSGSSSLKSEVKTNLTDPAVANAQAVKSRHDMMRKEVNDMVTNDGISSDLQSTPGPSQDGSSLNQTRTPKWFKKPFK